MMNRKGKLLLFILMFGMEFALGFYISYVLGYMHSDAISRVANAFYVLYSRDPHLGAIGFVWNPLPSLMELGLLVFYPLVPALATYGLAAVLMSSIFAALTSVLLYSSGKKMGIGAGISLTIALLYSLNPFVFLFGANGLSDAPYIYFIMYTVIEFCFWLKSRSASSLILSAFALAMAFWTRYEAVPLGVALAVGVVIAVFWMHRNYYSTGPTLREKAYKVEATWILLLIPAVFSGLLWIFFNYIIMDNPFYFLNSEYSNVAQSGQLQSDQSFVELFNSPWLALKFIAGKTLWYSAPLFAVLLIRLFTKRLFQGGTLIILLMFVSVPALQFVLLMRESSFGWFRYFMYVFPITVAWLPYELSLVRDRGRKLAFAVVVLSMLVTAGLLSYAMTDPSIAPDENNFINMADNEHLKEQELDRSVGAWIDSNMNDGTNIMTDSYSAYNLLVSSDNLKRYLITSDYKFDTALNDPPGNDVDYILIPKPLPGIPKSAINKLYPNMFEHGNEWATLYHDFDGKWRLYKIKKWVAPQG